MLCSISQLDEMKLELAEVCQVLHSAYQQAHGKALLREQILMPEKIQLRFEKQLQWSTKVSKNPYFKQHQSS